MVSSAPEGWSMGATCNSDSLKQNLRDILSREETKDKEAEYLRLFEEKEREILSRTVVVTDVADLTKKSNLKELRKFFQKYTKGGVEACWVSGYSEEDPEFFSPIPPARVRFKTRRHAERIFDNKKLLGLIRTKFIECWLGTRENSDGSRCIAVKPSYSYPGLLEGFLENTSVELVTSGLSLGHWFPLESDSFKTHIPPGMVADEFLEDTNTQLNPRLSFDFHTRTVELSTDRRYDDDGKFIFQKVTDSIKFSFKTISGKVELCHNGSNGRQTYSLVFALKHPPRLESERPLNGLGHALSRCERERDVRFDSVEAESFGKCFGLKIDIPSDELDRLLRNEKNLQSMKDFGLFRVDLHSIQQSRPTQTVVPISRSHPVAISAFQKLRKIHSHWPRVGFLLTALIDNGNMSLHHSLHDRGGQAKSNIFEMILGYVHPCHRQETATPACQSSDGWKIAVCLEMMLRRKTRYPCRMLDNLMKTETCGLEESELPDHCFSIPRLLLSPCRSAVQRFETDMGNSAIRMFVQEHGFSPESFLRVHVADEDGQKLFYRDLSTPLTNRLQTAIKNGISINSVEYKFFAFSSSQLKEAAIWMVSLEEDWDVEDLRGMLGDFKHCQTPSLYAARIGQRFSSSFQGTEGAHARGRRLQEPLRHIVVPDRFSWHGGRKMCHSDGTGLISREAANRVLSRMPNPPDNPEVVSILQVRFGGAKGTLTVWDNPQQFFSNSPVVQNVDVFLRDSMIKFNADYCNIEVCSFPEKHGSYYLNRNVILLLLGHGVKDSVFYNMQKAMLDDLDAMLTNREKALEMLPRLTAADQSLRSTLLHMIRSGLSPETDPFLCGCLHAIRTHHLFGLRKKARIFVHKGAVVMGGIDETGSLPEGCIFLQVRKDPSDSECQFEPIVGPVLVTKHPVMAQGDVRMLLGVDVAALRDKRNVLLFSRNSARPEPHKMAGSDLDGDEYAVTWDSRLFLNDWNGCYTTHEGIVKTRKLPGNRVIELTMTRENTVQDARRLYKANAKPLQYPRPDKKNQVEFPPGRSKSDLLIEHFFEFAVKDTLGQIGMLWQDYAARYGANDKNCQKLAELHSVAVDFAKTGVPAKIPNELTLNSKCPRAHWREKKNTPSFHCTSVIGKLYDNVIDRKNNVVADTALAGRAIDKYGQILSLVTKPQNKADFLERIYRRDIRDRLGYPRVDEEIQRFARERRFSYEAQLLAIMNRHGLRSEGEVFTGCIRKYHKSNKRRQYEVSEEVRRNCRITCQANRKKFFREVFRICVAASGKPNSYYTTNGDQGDGEDNDAILNLIEQVASGKTSDCGETSLTCAAIRCTAYKLAAAYYVATYCPDAQLEGEKKGGDLFCFSFPWIVADVIAAGLTSINQG